LRGELSEIHRLVGRIEPGSEAAGSQRLMHCHATSASSERNWSLWGRIYSAARSKLGMERAKALIAICSAESAKMPEKERFAITLNLIDQDE
jgi:hypothetical protein